VPISSASRLPYGVRSCLSGGREILREGLDKMLAFAFVLASLLATKDIHPGAESPLGNPGPIVTVT
jgi:hypothetical protein